MEVNGSYSESCDSVYVPVVWFSLGRKRSHDSAYESHSLTGDNQPLKGHVNFTDGVPKMYLILHVQNIIRVKWKGHFLSNFKRSEVYMDDLFPRHHPTGNTVVHSLH